MTEKNKNSICHKRELVDVKADGHEQQKNHKQHKWVFPSKNKQKTISVLEVQDEDTKDLQEIDFEKPL